MGLNILLFSFSFVVIFYSVFVCWFIFSKDMFLFTRPCYLSLIYFSGNHFFSCFWKVQKIKDYNPNLTHIAHFYSASTTHCHSKVNWTIEAKSFVKVWNQQHRHGDIEYKIERGKLFFFHLRFEQSGRIINSFQRTKQQADKYIGRKKSIQENGGTSSHIKRARTMKQLSRKLISERKQMYALCSSSL